jgi:hypothetical protein
MALGEVILGDIDSFCLLFASVIYVAWTRLNSGLSETLRMRLRVLHSVTLYVLP